MYNKQRYVEILVGIFIILGLLALVLLTVKVSGITRFNTGKNYQVTAVFSDVGGLKIRAPVTVAGVKIGEVTDIELQKAELNAKVTMQLQSDKLIPREDASARILTEGLLGSNYISIIPGFDDDKTDHAYLQEGDTIGKTQEAVILENLIGQLLFNIKK